MFSAAAVENSGLAIAMMRSSVSACQEPRRSIHSKAQGQVYQRGGGEETGVRFLANRTIKHTRITAQANQLADMGIQCLGLETRCGIEVRGPDQPLH
jgi:hypothetical protein